ncbi:MAG: long-chain fatty acid--CoA ligase, partial [Burkholderiales bacterium]
YGLLQKEVEKVNETLPEAAKLRRFVLLYKELDADDEELTRTRKVRRAFVEDRYQGVIDALYSDRTHVPIDTTIKFQDGKAARFQTTLLLRDLA